MITLFLSHGSEMIDKHKINRLAHSASALLKRHGLAISAASEFIGNLLGGEDIFHELAMGATKQPIEGALALASAMAVWTACSLLCMIPARKDFRNRVIDKSAVLECGASVALITAGFIMHNPGMITSGFLYFAGGCLESCPEGATVPRPVFEASTPMLRRAATNAKWFATDIIKRPMKLAEASRAPALIASCIGFFQCMPHEQAAMVITCDVLAAWVRFGTPGIETENGHVPQVENITQTPSTLVQAKLPSIKGRKRLRLALVNFNHLVEHGDRFIARALERVAANDGAIATAVANGARLVV